MVENHRAAVEVLDVDIAHGAIFDLVWRKETRFRRHHDGIGAGDDIGISHALIQVPIAIDLIEDIAAHNLLRAGGAKVGINNRRHDVICSAISHQRGENTALGRAMIRRADAHQMLDVPRTTQDAHPVPCDQPTLGMARNNDLLRARGMHDGLDIGTDLRRRFRNQPRGARAIIRGEYRPAVLAQICGKKLPDAFGITGAVQQNHRPRAFIRYRRSPVIFKNAAGF